MQGLNFGKFVALALASALIGSVIGTSALVTYEYLRQSNTSSETHLSGLVFVPVFSVVSLIGTVPGALIIGVPTLFSFRYLIARRPILMAIPTVLCSMGISFLLLGWAFKSPIFGYENMDVLWSYTGGTAFGFVAALGLWGRNHITKFGG